MRYANEVRPIIERLDNRLFDVQMKTGEPPKNFLIHPDDLPRLKAEGRVRDDKLVDLVSMTYKDIPIKVMQMTFKERVVALRTMYSNIATKDLINALPSTATKSIG